MNKNNMLLNYSNKTQNLSNKMLCRGRKDLSKQVLFIYNYFGDQPNNSL